MTLVRLPEVLALVECPLRRGALLNVRVCRVAHVVGKSRISRIDDFLVIVGLVGEIGEEVDSYSICYDDFMLTYYGDGMQNSIIEFN